MKYFLIVLATLLVGGCVSSDLSPSKIIYAKDCVIKDISEQCADGSRYYDYRIRLIGSCTKVHRFGFSACNDEDECYNTAYLWTPGEIEKLLVDELKNRGLYLNNYRYIRGEYGDTFVVVWGSPSPSSNKDRRELKEHHKIQELINLKKIYPSITNEVPKCECRYCTSGLDKKYWK